ncbi:MAG TPA: condensation domain-containing protein, partial [Blastocatellia bacterium]|nr:condensation domain-containing protein [Blastocatellia bacterium]
MSFFEQVNALSPTKRKLLELALSKRQGLQNGSQSEPGPSIQPVHRDQALPLSFAQERLWFLNQLTPNSPDYNIYEAIHLSGPLKIAVLEQSVGEVLRRHESLRTFFNAIDGRPLQSIVPFAPITISVVDISGLPADFHKVAVKEMVEEGARRPFDLHFAPLLRINVLRLGERQHVMSLVMHHIISDGWSAKVLIQELTAIYEAFSTGLCSGLAPLRIQYADVASWQRQQLQGEALEKVRSYWRNQLSGDLPLLEVPTDRPRPQSQGYNGAQRRIVLPSLLAKGLAEFSQHESVTLFTTLLAAFFVLLHRYTGQSDLIVSFPVANRRSSELEGLIGFFVNTLVARVKAEGNQSFRELLDRVRQVTFDALEHQDMPFEKLIEDLQPNRSLSHPTLSQVMFSFQQSPMRALTVSDLSVRLLETHNGTSKRDWTLTIEQSDGLTGSLEYNTDIFDSSTIARIEGHWLVLLQEVVSNPKQRLNEIKLLSEAEQHQLLQEWNDTGSESRFVALNRLFEMQVERTPDA